MYPNPLTQSLARQPQSPQRAEVTHDLSYLSQEDGCNNRIGIPRHFQNLTEKPKRTQGTAVDKDLTMRDPGDWLTSALTKPGSKNLFLKKRTDHIGHVSCPIPRRAKVTLDGSWCLRYTSDKHLDIGPDAKSILSPNLPIKSLKD